MDDSELYKLLLQAQTHGGNSFYDKFANAMQGMGALDSLDIQDENQYNRMSSALNAQADQALAGSAVSMLGGLSSIVNSAKANSQIGDISEQLNAIRDINNIGDGRYDYANQFADDYRRLNSIQPDLSYDAIRGGSNEERLGNTLSSTLSGAMTGLTVGGPWGAVAGAAVGLGSGIAGWMSGNSAAYDKSKHLRLATENARNEAINRMTASNEALLNRKFRQSVANSAADGGEIKTQSLKEFAEHALKRQRREFPVAGRIIRQHCDGGVMIRIKR